MKKITLTLVAFALVFTAFAQDVVINRLTDNTTALITTHGDTDAGVYCSDFFTLEEDVTLGSFTFPGFYSSATEIGDLLIGGDFYIYVDGGGFPDSDPTTTDALVNLTNVQLGAGLELLLDADEIETGWVVNVTAANGGSQVTLPAGDYWVAFAPYVVGGSAEGGRWNWSGSFTTEIGIAPANASLLIDPDDLFGAGATDWTEISGLIGADFPSFGWTLTNEESAGLGDNDLVGASVYPNPATNVINVDFSSNVELKSAVLFDVLGKNTGAALVNGSMNIADLAAGVYILNIETNNGSLTQKVIKQ
jgi:hypothetical protein